MSEVQSLPLDAITLRIATVRDQRVILDTDLATLYGARVRAAARAGRHARRPGQTAR